MCFRDLKTNLLLHFTREFRRAREKAGLHDCTFHHLRHTFISNLVTRLKEDMITVMELTGHKDIRMLKRYSHTREELKKEAMTKLESISKALNLESSGQDLGKIAIEQKSESGKNVP